MENEYTKIYKNIFLNPIFEFNGIINLGVLTKIISEAEEHINKIHSTNSFYRKSYFIFVEILQNAFRHGVQNNNIRLVVNAKENELYFLCENLIYTDEVSKLKSEIEELNKFDIKQLKEYYKAKLKTGYIGMGSSSVGLVDIRRKTGNKLVFNFTEINKKHTSFSIISTISIQKLAE